MGEPRKCEVCGDEFRVPPSRVKRGGGRFCSTECRTNAPKSLLDYRCDSCGTPFQAFPSERRRFCSQACGVAYRTVRKPFPCERCGAECYPQRNQRRFCSLACAGKAARSGIEKPCESCGKVMYVEPAQQSFKRFCSRACSNEGLRLKGPGSRHVRPDGYVAIYYPSHPDVGKNRFILEHRLVMEKELGRRILRSEHVHHINHVKDDNPPENLQLTSASEHGRTHGKDERRTMRSRLAEYEERFGPLP